MSGDARGKGRWTLRFVLRSAGIAALAIVIPMALLGAYVFDLADSARSFFIYWTIFFILLLSAIAIAVVDTLLTIVRFRKEHMKLRKAFRRGLHEDRGAEPLGKRLPHGKQ
jgi:hypothetical protein